MQIAELIVAGLSSVKLSRWYAFECYVQALGNAPGQELHMKCAKTVVTKNALFPKLKEVRKYVRKNKSGVEIRVFPHIVNYFKKMKNTEKYYIFLTFLCKSLETITNKNVINL